MIRFDYAKGDLDTFYVAVIGAYTIWPRVNFFPDSFILYLLNRRTYNKL